MKKSELIDQVAEKAQTTKDAAARVIDAIFDAASGSIAQAVSAGQQVSIPGFGKFRPKTRSARKARNPRTGATIDVPERTVVSFTPGKGLRETLGGPTAAGQRAGATKKTSAAAGAAKKATAKKATATKTTAKNTTAKKAQSKR